MKSFINTFFVSTFLVLAAIASITSTNLVDAKCLKWGDTYKVGQLDEKILNEASSIAISKNYNRLYHMNDSIKDTTNPTGYSTAPYFYYTDDLGSKTTKVKINNVSLTDVEDMTYGSCHSKVAEDRCIFIADIGIARGDRKNVSKQIIIIKEMKNFPASVDPIVVIPIQLQIENEQKMDAESIGIHPDGDLYILSKNYHYKGFKNSKAFASNLFRLKKQKWVDYKKSDKTLTMKNYGTIDLSDFFSNSKNIKVRYPDFPGWLYQVPTSMDISKDGSKFIILTYLGAIEIHYDLSQGELSPGFAKSLLQKSASILQFNKEFEIQTNQEAIAYSKDTVSFIYTSEYNAKKFPGKKPLILKRKCLSHK
ncbi:MAG: hypothetical protein ISR65_02010 [Bacteriovoracaceae bacterium]|nr:hypothetical protein [Bacteriovoracaceae bacterium]